MKSKYLIIAIFLVCLQGMWAQKSEKATGPVIDDYGAVWDIDNPDLEIGEEDEFHLVFDIYSQASTLTSVNPSINTLARFLNMHSRAGVSLDKIKLVAVVHNKAGNDMMKNRYYQQKYGVDNPNLALIDELSDAGVAFYICGQTMNSRGLLQEEMNENIKVSLSAMTAIVKFVNEGYTLIKF